MSGNVIQPWDVMNKILLLPLSCSESSGRKITLNMSSYYNVISAIIEVYQFGENIEEAMAGLGLREVQAGFLK